MAGLSPASLRVSAPCDGTVISPDDVFLWAPRDLLRRSTYGIDVEGDIDVLLDNSDVLTEWDEEFALSVGDQFTRSKKQIVVIPRIAARLRRMARQHPTARGKGGR